MVTGYPIDLALSCGIVVCDPVMGAPTWDEEYGPDPNSNHYCYDVTTGVPAGRSYLTGASGATPDVLTLAFDVLSEPTTTSTLPVPPAAAHARRGGTSTATRISPLLGLARAMSA